MSPAAAKTRFDGWYVRDQKSRTSSSVSPRTLSSSPAISQPSGVSPKKARSKRLKTYWPGSSRYERISSTMMSRSRAMSALRSSGRTVSSARTPNERSASRIGTRAQYTVDSRSVAALEDPP